MVLKFQRHGVDIAGGPTKFVIETGFIDVVAGDLIQCVIKDLEDLSVAFSASPVTSGFSLKKEGSNFSNDVKLQVISGAVIEISNQLPDITQLELLQSLRDIFNLYIQTDTGAREIIIEPRDDFYKAQAVNWTDKLDRGRTITNSYLNENLKKIINYRYKADPKDENVEAFEEQNDIILAQHEETNLNKFVDGEQDAGSKTFAPTFMAQFPYVGLFTASVPVLHNEVVPFPSSPKRSTDFDLRLLFYNGVTSLSSGEQWFFEGVSRTDYPYFYAVDVVNDNDNSLYFQNTRRSKGLFEKFHRNDFETRMQGRLFAASFNLDDVDANHDFRIPILIDQTYYLLNKIISYNPLIRSVTKVELIKSVGLDISAIIEGEGGSVIPPLPPDPDSQPVSEVQDPATQPQAAPPTPDLPTISTTGGGIVVQGVGNDIDDEGATGVGVGLTSGTTGQQVWGTFNEEDDDAIAVWGGGTSENDTVNIMTIDSSGNLNLAGQPMVLHINNILHPLMYTDNKGDLREMYKHKNA